MKYLIQCGDHFENQNRVFLLAQEIYKAGHDPVILMYKPSKGNIFKISSIEVIALNDFFVSQETKGLNFESKIYKELKVKDFVEVEGKRRPELTWPSRQAGTAQSVQRHVDAVQKILHKIQPDHVIIWNGFTGYVANALRKICALDGIPCAFLERGLFKDSIFIDHLGVNGAASISQIDSVVFDPNAVDAAAYAYLNSCFKLDQHTELEEEDLPEVVGKRVVFFPLQVQLDTNIVLYSPYKTMRHALFSMYKYLSDENTIFVLRPHPEESPEQRLNIPRWKNVVISTEKSLEYWIRRCDLVVTINSTVGLEALIQHKPVICLGGSIYSAFPYLVSLDDLSVDKAECSKNLVGYLGYLMRSNILKSDSPWRNHVVATQLKWHEAAQLVRQLPFDIVKKNIQEWLKNCTVDLLKVCLAFPFEARLNLTYRKYDEPLSKSWVNQIVQTWIGEYPTLISSEMNAGCVDILIVDESQDFDPRDAILVIDLYGIPLAFDGKTLV